MMVKFKGLQSQEVFSMSEIIFCHNSSLHGQYSITEDKDIRTLNIVFVIHKTLSFRKLDCSFSNSIAHSDPIYYDMA